MSPHQHQIGFGGGCHWCTEAVFASLKGMHSVQQGFISSHAPHDQYSEAVLVKYDETQISLETLIEIHLRTHASTAAHSMREKYRSALYVDNPTLRDACTSALRVLQSKFDKTLITQVLETVHFKSSTEPYTDYYTTDPNRPFCVTYIEPKLTLLKREFKPYLKPSTL